MSKCVAAGFSAGVVACAVFSLASAAWAQDVPPPPVPPEPEDLKTEEQIPPSNDNDTALPGIVVTSPDPVPYSASAQSSASSSGGGGGQSTGPGEAATEEVLDGVILGGPAVSDTGTTVFDSRNVMMRTDGGGDANSFMRNLPNVQYQNDTDENPGATPQSVIDTRPMELSINGAQTYENNFILNGVSISTISGPVEPGNFSTNLERDGTPNLNSFYGLHSQTVFVPAEFIGTATLIESNASAEYGQFQGGVVLYDLARPPTDGYHASVTYSHHSDDMVDYLLVTPDGRNPLARIAPTFTKNNLAASVARRSLTNSPSSCRQAARKPRPNARRSTSTTTEWWERIPTTYSCASPPS